MSRGNVGVTSPFVLPSPRMGSSTVMPIRALITQLTFSHFWTDCKTSSLQLTRCTRCNSLSSGTMSFHRSALVQNWFQHHQQFTLLYLPPYSPFLNPIEKFFSAWRWKVYDLRLQAQVPLIQAMEEACDQIDAVAVQGWIRHSRRFFPRCLANEDIACDVDEILWPDPARRRDDA